jgi:hypothetical protein
MGPLPALAVPVPNVFTVCGTAALPPTPWDRLFVMPLIIVLIKLFPRID